MLHRALAGDHIGNIANIDGSPVACGDEEQTDIGHSPQRLAGCNRKGRAGAAHLAGEERAVGTLHLGDELCERDAVERKLLRVRLDPYLLRAPARDIAEPDIVDLHELGA